MKSSVGKPALACQSIVRVTGARQTKVLLKGVNRTVLKDLNKFCSPIWAINQLGNHGETLFLSTQGLWLDKKTIDDTTKAIPLILITVEATCHGEPVKVARNYSDRVFLFSSSKNYIHVYLVKIYRGLLWIREYDWLYYLCLSADRQLLHALLYTWSFFYLARHVWTWCNIMKQSFSTRYWTFFFFLCNDTTVKFY